MTDVDPRVEAAARAMCGESWRLTLATGQEMWREEARKVLAAADAVDPLRDCGRAVSGWR